MREIKNEKWKMKLQRSYLANPMMNQNTILTKLKKKKVVDDTIGNYFASPDAKIFRILKNSKKRMNLNQISRSPKLFPNLT